MRDKRKLRVWADPEYTEPQSIARPMPGEVLYELPNPDGTRKSCQNCVHWLSTDNECFLFPPDVVVPAGAICGYHVFGRPRAGGNSVELQAGMQPVDPEYAGFDHVAGGTSCDRCAHYSAINPLEGKCGLVVDPDEGTDFTVQALACCSMWVSSDG